LVVSDALQLAVVVLVDSRSLAVQTHPGPFQGVLLRSREFS
jgi:hypothetical protein